jgi:hypothetical protein
VIIYHQKNVTAFAGNHNYLWLPQQVIVTRIASGFVYPDNVKLAQIRWMRPWDITIPHSQT